jgi:UDP-3-O-[3-hydroxymyristoyl] glucosamine N-acyltransferase
MSAPFFFKRSGGLSLREIAALVSGEAGEGADLDRRISGIAPLDRAGPNDLSFLDNPKYVELAATTAAGICLTTERFAGVLPPRVCVLFVREPYRALVEVARALFPDALRPTSLFDAGGILPGAHIHPSARLENGVTVDPGAVIGARAEIGGGTVIGAGAVIATGVRIGRDCSIGANASIMHALIGDRVIIHPGCAIGQDGFGFVRGPRGAHKVPQIGRVIIQDDVEIGANSTIDRGAIRDTVIGEGTKIDNLVQIAHNVWIGRHCLLAALVGLSGSSTIEDGVVMGGQVGVADHITVGPGAMVAAQSGLMNDVPAGGRWAGSPAKSAKQWFREIATLEALAKQGRGGRHQDDD